VFGDIIDGIGRAVDALGVAIIVVGTLLAIAPYVLAVARRRDSLAAYRDVRRNLGRAILLGLEFLVAGDIIRTVAATPTFASVGVLALIVVIRSFLSITLEVEVAGRWPWNRADDAKPT